MGLFIRSGIGESILLIPVPSIDNCCIGTVEFVKVFVQLWTGLSAPKCIVIAKGYGEDSDRPISGQVWVVTRIASLVEGVEVTLEPWYLSVVSDPNPYLADFTLSCFTFGQSNKNGLARFVLFKISIESISGQFLHKMSVGHKDRSIEHCNSQMGQ
jgi:hypothetical protein